MIERKFVKKGIRNAELDSYFQKELERVDYSHCDIQRTPLNTRIVIYAGRPGMVIGRGGSKIQEMTEVIEQKFSIEKPQLEVRALEKPELDAAVIAKQISAALEKGMSYKRIINIYLKKIMDAGALGVEIVVAGKISGERSRSEKFREGYLKKSGYPAEALVSKGKEMAILKAGALGVSVKIMKDVPAIMKVEKNIEYIREDLLEEEKKKKKEKEALEAKPEEKEEETSPTEEETKEGESKKKKKAAEKEVKEEKKTAEKKETKKKKTEKKEKKKSE